MAAQGGPSSSKPQTISLKPRYDTFPAAGVGGVTGTGSSELPGGHVGGACMELPGIHVMWHLCSALLALDYSLSPPTTTLLQATASALAGMRARAAWG